MILSSDIILTESEAKIHGILREFHEAVNNCESEGKLTINSVVVQLGILIKSFIAIALSMAGSYLSDINECKKTEVHCSCGRKMIRTKKDSEIKILTRYGYIPIKRDEYFCRRCHKGFGITDRKLEISNEHRMDKETVEIISYMAQLVPSFDRASKSLKKLIGIEVSPTQMQIVSEEIGKKVFEKDKKEAKEAYEKPELVAPHMLEKDKKNETLYVFTDGSLVNTRIVENNTSFKEMKLGLIFNSKDVIKKGKENQTITKKEYVSYFGSVNEFEKLLFCAVAKAGYGSVKEVVVVGDGAHWIWNMSKSILPDAVTILDFYHLSENVHKYAAFLYPEDEVARKRWANTAINLARDGKTEEFIKMVEERKVEKTPEGVVNLYTYVTNNKDRINYKEYEEKGYYIGSGAIESGNKTVIQQRMKQAGMRWSVAGGQYIAALRAKHESDMWDKVKEVIGL